MYLEEPLHIVGTDDFTTIVTEHTVHDMGSSTYGDFMSDSF